MKIIGGLDSNGNFTGIFVRQILPDSIVDNDGKNTSNYRFMVMLVISNLVLVFVCYSNVFYKVPM